MRPKVNSERSLEEQLDLLNKACADTTGLGSFPAYNKKRKEVLEKISNERNLTRWEYICLYDYAAWRDYVKIHNLPENHPHADL